MLKNSCCRVLNEKDSRQVEELDNLSGNNVSFFLDSENSFGIFLGDKLVGYLSAGYADDCPDEITNDKYWDMDSRLISDVFVIPEYRNKGLISKLFDYVLNQKEITEYGVYLSVVNYGLFYLYEKIGFKQISEWSMRYYKETPN